MNKEIFTQILFMAAGLFSILGAYLEWDLFYKNRKAQRIIRLFGQSGAKIFYIVIGLMIFTIALLDITHIIDIHLIFGRRAAMRQ